MLTDIADETLSRPANRLSEPSLSTIKKEIKH
jgi:hypothetical protein